MKKVLSILTITIISSLMIINFAASAINNSPETATESSETSSTDAGADDDIYQNMREDADTARKLVVAKVNYEEISMFSLVRAMNRVAPQYIKPGEEITPEITAKVKKEALDRLIFERLAIQHSYKSGIEIQKEEIDKVIENVKKSLGGDTEFKEYLEKRDLSEDELRNQIERSRRREKVMAREIYGKVKVKEEKIIEKYEEMKASGKLRTADDYIVKDALVLAGEDEKATEKRAQDLLAEIQKHDGDMSKLVLDGTFIVRRLKVDKGKYPEIIKAMERLRVGRVSGVIKEKDSYHIVKVLKKEKARDLTLEESRGFIENKLRVPAQDERKAAWKKELRENAKVEIFLEEVEKERKEKAEALKEQSSSNESKDEE